MGEGKSERGRKKRRRREKERRGEKKKGVATNKINNKAAAKMRKRRKSREKGEGRVAEAQLCPQSLKASNTQTDRQTDRAIDFRWEGWVGVKGKGCLACCSLKITPPAGFEGLGRKERRFSSFGTHIHTHTHTRSQSNKTTKESTATGSSSSLSIQKSQMK